MGYHQRIEFNKRILKIGKDGKEVTVKGGYIRYGEVKGPYILIEGSIPGTEKRQIRLRVPARPPTRNPRSTTTNHICIAGISTRKIRLKSYATTKNSKNLRFKRRINRKNNASKRILNAAKTRRNKTCSTSHTIKQVYNRKAETPWLEKEPLQNHAEQAAQPQEFPASKAAVEEQLLLQAQLKEGNLIRQELKRKY